MIARLKGLLDEVGPDWVVIDVAGVGYLVYCPGRVIAGLPAVGQPVAMHIETHVREDHIHLYGFSSTLERECFRMLTTVQGVGAKVGLAILGTLSVDELTTAIVAQDKAMLSRPDGVGPRLAARLMTERMPEAKGALADFDGEARPPEILFPPRNAELWAGTVDGQVARPFVLAGRGETDLRWYVDGAPVKLDDGGLPSWRPTRAGFYEVSAIDADGRASRVEVRVLGPSG